MVTQTLYILQGAPGSGKSRMAHSIKTYCSMANHCVAICSTDDFHYEDGIYKFKPENLGEFHKKNLEQAIRFMSAGFTTIIDNTNIKRVHCKPYVEHAMKLAIPVVFVRVTGHFPNIHGVPDDVVRRMREQMEDLSLESVLNS